MAVDVRSAVNGQSSSQAGQILSATVSSQQPVPTSFTDPLYVVLDNTKIPLTFVNWPRSQGATLPAAGDTVVVGYTQDNVPHVLGWGI